MALDLVDIDGKPFIGVYCKSSEDIVLHPPGLPKNVVKKIGKILEAEPREITIGGSRIIGPLCAMNGHGAVVADFIGSGDAAVLKERGELLEIPHKLNAAGNNILCNHKAALIHVAYPAKIANMIADTLDVEVVKGTIAGIKTVGSVAVAVETGVLCHPRASESDLEMLRDLFKVEVMIGTANYGSPLLGACIIANSKGAVAGTPTTGIELGRIEEGLGLLK
jgi:translation initiation factor 6